MRPIIYPYNMRSSSAKALANALKDVRAKRVRPDGNYRPYHNHLAINWGNSHYPDWWIELSPDIEPPNALNYPAAVNNASNKLLTFQVFAAWNENQHDAAKLIPYPDWTAEFEIAQDWLANGCTVLARHNLTGHSGQGIVVHTPDNPDLARAPLYVKYKKKKKEFRVHVFKNPNGELEVIDVQEKRKDRDYGGERDNRIRSHSTGWVYCRNEILEPQGLRSNGINAVAALALDFGAVDIIWNERENKCYVLEVNTAPGLEGTTLTKYVDAIKRWI